MSSLVSIGLRASNVLQRVKVPLITYDVGFLKRRAFHEFPPGVGPKNDFPQTPGRFSTSKQPPCHLLSSSQYKPQDSRYSIPL